MGTRNARARCGGWAAAVLGLAVIGGGCNLDRQFEPNLTGPSDAAVSVELVAAPDTVNGDGVSMSLVSLVVRNNLGEPIKGWPILFQCNGGNRSCNGWGKMRPAPGSMYVGPVQSGEVMATDANGSTSVMYTAAYGTGFVTIGVRPYGTDTSYTTFYRYVEIVLQ
jgi:hypothetical protein